jgi:hypothetical protein
VNPNPTRVVRVPDSQATELAQRVALFAVVMGLRAPEKVLAGFGELVREDAQRMLMVVTTWSSATRQARVSLEFGKRSDQVERMQELLTESSPMMRRALWAQMPGPLQLRFPHLASASKPSPAMESLAARMVCEVTR